jgi:hypothetical protein
MLTKTYSSKAGPSQKSETPAPSGGLLNPQENEMSGFTITYKKAGLTVTIHTSDERAAKRVIVQALKDAEVTGIAVRREVA